MGHYKLLFPRNYVGACDLVNGEQVVTIERIVVEELKADKGRSDTKPIIYLKGAKKKWVLNKTNAKIIAAMYGTNTDDWKGKRITLYATTCSGQGGEEVECIRVRPAVPKGKAAPLAESKQDAPDPDPMPERDDVDPDTGEVLDEPPAGMALPHD